MQLIVGFDPIKLITTMLHPTCFKNIFGSTFLSLNIDCGKYKCGEG